MYILGIDPGLQNLGFAIAKIKFNSENQENTLEIIKTDTIKTNNKISFIEKLEIITKELENIINSYSFTYCGIETTFMHKGIKANMNFTKTYGAILSAINKNNIKIFELTPAYVKKMITQNGKATKFDIMNMIKLLFPEATPKTEHESDALAILYTAFLSIK